MGFRLRGGTPKNMGQGIYWVQRNLADQRAAAAHQRRIQKAEDFAKDFNNRFQHIQLVTKDYFDKLGSFKTTDKESAKWGSINNTYNIIVNSIYENIQEATNRDLNKLATAAKNLIIFHTKVCKIETKWHPGDKILEVNGNIFDFY